MTTDHLESLTPEDRAVMTAALKKWKDDGVENPTIPSDVDLDGDGVVDAFGLDENDQLIFISGIKLTDTVYRSDGDDAIIHHGPEAGE